VRLNDLAAQYCRPAQVRAQICPKALPCLLAIRATNLKANAVTHKPHPRSAWGRGHQNGIHRHSLKSLNPGGMIGQAVNKGKPASSGMGHFRNKDEVVRKPFRGFYGWWPADCFGQTRPTAVVQ
jgi:hypothetical protein